MTLKSVSSVVAMAVLALGVHANAKDVEAGTYQIDAMHSSVGFEIPHLVISTVEGKFTQVEGQLDLDKKFTNSKATAKIAVASIDTGVGKRDEHLKSPDFFDAAKHSDITFKSSKVEGTPEAFKLTGDLTIKGTTKKVTLEGKYLGSVVDGYGNQKVAFTLKGKINRKDFGLTWSQAVEAGPVVGDEVTLTLKLQAGHPAAKK